MFTVPCWAMPPATSLSPSVRCITDSRDVEATGSRWWAACAKGITALARSSRPRSAMTSTSAVVQACPIVGHSAARPRACAAEVTPWMRFTPHARSWDSSNTTSALGVPPRTAAASLSRPLFADTGPPWAARQRYARSPPAGSASSSTTGLGHTAASARAVEVTPGDPLTDANAISTAHSPDLSASPPVGAVSTTATRF